jgi:integrase
MSELATLLDDYLAVRRAVGFKVTQLGHELPRFVAFCDAAGADTITTELALRWAGQGPNAPKRLGMVRVFARYVQSVHPATEVPPPELLPVRNRRRVPSLLSEDEVGAIMATLRAFDPSLRSAEVVIGLLWATGLRVGEALVLERSDVSFDDGLLTVRASKNNKSRLVPLSVSTSSELDAYARHRDRLWPRPRTERFFVGVSGDPLSYGRLRSDFGRALETGPTPWSDPLPRLGDLRHAFAVRTLLGWYRSGLHVEALLPRLSTYLGHVSPASTYWYLSAAPELMAIAAERLAAIGTVQP